MIAVNTFHTISHTSECFYSKLFTIGYLIILSLEVLGTRWLSPISPCKTYMMYFGLYFPKIIFLMTFGKKSCILGAIN